MLTTDLIEWEHTIRKKENALWRVTLVNVVGPKHIDEADFTHNGIRWRIATLSLESYRPKP